MTPPSPKAHLAVLAILCAMLLPLHRAAAALGTLDGSLNLPTSRLVLDPVRPRMYASITGSNCVAVIDTNTLKLIEMIPIGSAPLGLTVSADGTKLYVANSGSTTNGVGVIDLNTLQVLPSLALPSAPCDVAEGVDSELYLPPGVPQSFSGLMEISASGSIPAVVYNGINIYGGGYLQVSPDGQTLFFGDAGLSPASLSSFDISSGTANLLDTNSTTMGSNGKDLEISHGGAFLSFATGSGQNDGYDIAEIPANDLSASNGTFNTGAYPTNIAFSPDDALAYTSPEDSSEMYVYNTSTFLLTGSFSVPGDVIRLKTDSSGRRLFAAMSDIDDNPLNINVYETGRLAAVITSATSQSVATGAPFSYQITASNSSGPYNATGLPPGLSVSTSSGMITGTCNTPGFSQVVISASNAIGVAMANLYITAGTPPTASLTVSVSGSGSVSSGFAGATSQVVGSMVSVSATASPGYVFAGWTGGITTTANPLSFIFESATSVQANFVPATLGTLDATFYLPAVRFAVDPVRPRIYASITGSNSVAVIDTSTLSLIALIPVGTSPIGLAVSPDGSRLYVANSGLTTGGVSVVDLTTLTVLPSINTPQQPSDIVVGGNGWLYLSPHVDGPSTALMQVSASGNSSLTFTDGAFPYADGYLQISPDQNTLYFGNASLSPSSLYRFNVSTSTPALSQQYSTVSTENGEDLVLSHSGAFLAFPNGGGQGSGFGTPYTIQEIPTGNISAYNGSFSTGAYPTNLAFSPDDAFAYTAPDEQGQVIVYDTSTFAVTGTFPVTNGISRLKTDCSGRYLFAAAYDSSFNNLEINVYDTGRLAAAITSTTSAQGVVGDSFSYQITASNSPTSYNAYNLPPGLSVDTASGLVSGTCTTSGTWQAVVSASNAIGVAMGNLAINVLATAPTVPLTVTVAGSGTVTSGYLGTSYPTAGSTITLSATAAPGYIFTGWTGGISSLSNPLVFVIETATLVQANFVSSAAAVTSNTESGLNYGSHFSYQINATGIGPFSYSATGLPSGLTVNPSSGLISGSLGNAGSFNAILTATNATTEGYGTGILSLQVNAQQTVTAGVGGTATPAGVSYARLNSSQTITATPYTGYLFKDWTGPTTSPSNPLVIPMPAVAQWTANFVPAAFYAGSYSGLVSSGAPAVASSGMLVIKLLNTSVFTGYLEIGGGRYAIESDFSPSNSTQITIPRRGAVPITLYLTLGLTGGTPVLTGTATDGTWTSALSTSLATVYPPTAPCPLAGSYTLALSSTAGPTGSGYASLSVSKAGMGSMSGALADGTPFSVSAPIQPGGSMNIYTPLYANKGGLAGSVTFLSSSSTGLLTGTMDWWKPAGPATSAYPPAISTALQVEGSSYHYAPVTAELGELHFSGGRFPGTAIFGFSVTPPLKFTFPPPEPRSISFAISPLTGVFGGTVLEITNRVPFHGVLLQQQGTGAGYFTDSTGGGAVSVSYGP